MSQTELAQELGVSVGLLNNVLNGIREPGPKVLRALGIRRESIYVLEPNAQIPEGIAARAPPKRKKRTKGLPSRIVTQRVGLPARTLAILDAAVAECAPKLDVKRVQIAMRYGLVPATAWSAFLPSFIDSDMPINDAWEHYCAKHGTAPTQKPIVQETLGKPGELYSHLKPVNRGIDHRKPKAFGEHPDLVQYNSPEASQS